MSNNDSKLHINTILLDAINHHDTEQIRFLLTRGDDICDLLYDNPVSYKINSVIEKNGKLMNSIQQQKMIKQHTKMNQIVYEVAGKGYISILKLIVKETDIPSDHLILLNAFDIACINDKLDIIEYLLEKKVNKNNPALLNNKIKQIAGTGSLRIIECLIKHGASDWIPDIQRDQLLEFLNQKITPNSQINSNPDSQLDDIVEI